MEGETKCFAACRSRCSFLAACPLGQELPTCFASHLNRFRSGGSLSPMFSLPHPAPIWRGHLHMRARLLDSSTTQQMGPFFSSLLFTTTVAKETCREHSRWTAP